MSFATLKNKLREYSNRAQKLGETSAKIGVLGGNYNDKEETPVAYVAAIQEYGSPSQSIPPRPFMRPTVQAHKKEWAEQLGFGLQKVISQNADPVVILGAVAETGALQMKGTITEIHTPPLAPATIKRRMAKTKDKGARGGSFDKPLEDTFTLYDSINSEVDG